MTLCDAKSPHFDIKCALDSTHPGLHTDDHGFSWWVDTGTGDEICEKRNVGRKDDGADGKLPAKTPFHQLPWRAIEELAWVMDHGARKYGEKNYLKVEGGRWRYFSAALRHLVAWWGGEKLDPESKKHHLAHAMACCVILMERESHGSQG